ncbi:MAG: hypothetical protein DMG81_12000 [Acidobacteria bacterium]|nr:MAG: hypothetical protein DMG81_12000 [Acidobacteriota bacterium]
MRISVLIGIAAAALAILLAMYVAVLRPWHLRWGATPAEATQSLPGDDLLEGKLAQVTRAVTIQATPEKIWPWLMQIGQDRGGFYSYTPLENMFGADMPEVHRLRPEWKPRAVGETVWFATPRRFDGQGKMIAATVDAPRAFVMVMPSDWEKISQAGRGSAGSWGFVLVPMDAEHTRLIARLRSGPPVNLKARLAGSLFWEPAHFVMERKMLLTIKRLAEETR